MRKNAVATGEADIQGLNDDCESQCLLIDTLEILLLTFLLTYFSQT